MAGPCFMCPDRDYPRCYGYCKKYLEYKQSLEAVRAKRAKEDAVDAFVLKGVERARKYLNESKGK